MTNYQAKILYTIVFVMSYLLGTTVAFAGGMQGEAGAAPPPNPFLSAAVYGITHVDPAQTDAIPYAVTRGTFHVDLSALEPIWGGPVNLMTLASTAPEFMWAVSTDRVAYVDASGANWRRVADIALPGTTQIGEAALRRLLDPTYQSVEQVEQLLTATVGSSPASILSRGLYVLVDVDNLVYVNAGTVVAVIGLRDAANPAAGLEVKRQLDTTPLFFSGERCPSGQGVRLVGMGMTYDGYVVIGGSNGIAVVDRAFTQEPRVYCFEPEQTLTNSLAIDEHGGIYVATGSLTPRQPGIMRKLVWTGSRLSNDAADGAWSSPYEGGDVPPAIKFGTGTGSTPTLMGFAPHADRLVVITDGANRMHIVAFWRDAIPPEFVQKPGTLSRRIADQFPITAGLPEDQAWIQSEQSVVVRGWGAFVVNNIPPPEEQPPADKIVDVLTLGPLREPPRGVERVAWDPVRHRFYSVWTRGDVVSISMIPLVSRPSAIVFVNGYTPQEGWEVTGLSWYTGKTVHRTIFGQTNYGNGAYALVQFLANGDLLFNSVGGPFRISYE
jgi:hypothetical protein